jgi:hypothetical protein
LELYILPTVKTTSHDIRLMNLVKVKGKEKERERLQKYIYGVTYQNRISSSIIATITPKTEIAYYSTLVQVAKA